VVVLEVDFDFGSQGLQFLHFRHIDFRVYVVLFVMDSQFVVEEIEDDQTDGGDGEVLEEYVAILLQVEVLDIFFLLLVLVRYFYRFEGGFIVKLVYLFTINTLNTCLEFVLIGT
jgi:hypothetical protein